MNFFYLIALLETKPVTKHALWPTHLSLEPDLFFGNIAFILLFIAVLLYWFDFFDTKHISKKIKSFCMLGANFSLACLMIFRWYESGHFPLSNLYESLIGLSWGFTAVHLIMVLNWSKFIKTFFAKQVITSLYSDKHSEFSVYKDTQKAEQNKKTAKCTDSLLHKTNNQNYAPYLNSTNYNKKTPYPLYFSESILCDLSLAAFNKIPAKAKIGNNIESQRPCSKEALVTCLTESLTLGQAKQTRMWPSAKTISNFKTQEMLGIVTAPTALLTSAFATFFLPPELTRASALVPALKSNWLTMHVTVMIASYAFLLIGSLLSIAFCAFQLTEKFSIWFSEKNNSVNSANQNTNTSSNIFNQENFQQIQTISHNADLSMWLNNTSYRILGLGFPLLTIGILSGAVWANEAWGSYWSWDPKETWALITWLVFAVYFHSRYIRSPDSSLPATIASIGFVVIWICYLGVNLLGSGLHSYGWFNN